MLLYVIVVCILGVNIVDSNDQKCGVEKSSELIHFSPWLVFIEYYRRDSFIDIRCAGSIVSLSHVVTAAHCVRSPKYSYLVARLGEYDLNEDVDCVNDVCADPVVQIKVRDVIVHPAFNGKDHDIAVLILEKEAPYTDFIRPICLPSGALTKDAVFVATGWGEIPKLHYYAHIKKILILPYWNRESCQISYKTYPLPKNVICAGGEDGIDTCRGDSGGPLVLIKSRTELWGITSSGNTVCGTEGSPGIYTRVDYYLEWIEDILKGNHHGI